MPPIMVMVRVRVMVMVMVRVRVRRAACLWAGVAVDGDAEVMRESEKPPLHPCGVDHGPWI